MYVNILCEPFLCEQFKSMEFARIFLVIVFQTVVRIPLLVRQPLFRLRDFNKKIGIKYKENSNFRE